MSLPRAERGDSKLRELNSRRKEKGNGVHRSLSRNMGSLSEVSDKLVERQEYRDYNESHDSTHSDNHNRLQHRGKRR